jgi:hypothetical protein
MEDIEREVAQAAEFPSIHRIGSGGCDACPGADREGRTGQRRDERRRIGPGLFRDMESSSLSLVRAPGIRFRPGDEQVALAATTRRRHLGLVVPSPVPPGAEGVSD